MVRKPLTLCASFVHSHFLLFDLITPYIHASAGFPLRAGKGNFATSSREYSQCTSTYGASCLPVYPFFPIAARPIRSQQRAILGVQNRRIPLQYSLPSRWSSPEYETYNPPVAASPSPLATSRRSRPNSFIGHQQQGLYQVLDLHFPSDKFYFGEDSPNVVTTAKQAGAIPLHQ